MEFIEEKVMAFSKLANRALAGTIGLLLVFSVVAEAQPPGRQPTRRVEGQRRDAPQPEGASDRRRQREIPRRTEERTPLIDLRTGTFDLRREIFRQGPRRSPRRVTSRWRLGVWTDNAPAGLRIREVSRYSPGWRFGLEEGDYLMDIMGYPVGFYEGAYYPLADTLNQVTPPDGWINVLVWNKRTNSEETMWMQAEPRAGFGAGESSE
jgi:hypothetical protein